MAAAFREDSVLQGLLQGARHTKGLQAAERLDLHLADALARHAELLPDLLECHWVLAAQAITQLDDLALALRESRKRPREILLHDLLRRDRLGLLRRIVLDEVGERGVRVAHRRFQRY